MRGHIADLETPHPLGTAMPSMYHDDSFVQRFLSALDAVLAPAISTLDNFETYLEPQLAPTDFIEWLGGWVGLVIDPAWPLDQRRILVSRAVELYRQRGTVRGIAGLVAMYTGSEPEIVESGGAAWSAVPRGPLPGASEAQLTVRIRAANADSVDVRRIDALIASAKPANVPHRVEIVTT
jgi:phage tail-like protein